MRVTTLWHRIAPSSWHALAYGLGSEVLIALVGVVLWQSQPPTVTTSVAPQVQLTVTADSPVHVAIIQPVSPPSAGIEA